MTGSLLADCIEVKDGPFREYLARRAREAGRLPVCVKPRGVPQPAAGRYPRGPGALRRASREGRPAPRRRPPALGPRLGQRTKDRRAAHRARRAGGTSARRPLPSWRRLSAQRDALQATTGRSRFGSRDSDPGPTSTSTRPSRARTTMTPNGSGLQAGSSRLEEITRALDDNAEASRRRRGADRETHRRAGHHGRGGEAGRAGQEARRRVRRSTAGAESWRPPARRTRPSTNASATNRPSAGSGLRRDRDDPVRRSPSAHRATDQRTRRLRTEPGPVHGRGLAPVARAARGHGRQRRGAPGLPGLP